mgnify:CR=1 FL=1|tara:strand:+ start:151 stop:453 length:303 start_codon:yes stop_codon:yes gene_type:complete
MITSPDAVYIIIPCMKELGMSWSEIKATPRHELLGLLGAMSHYNIIHAFDGYTPDDVSEMAKNKPQVRSQYADCQNLKSKYDLRSGKRESRYQSFGDLIK